MTSFARVMDAYRAAAARLGIVLTIFLGVRLLGVAVVAPLIGFLLALSLRLSGQTALTDQDIAGFLLTPAGFVAAMVVLSALLLSAILAFAAMAVDLRMPQAGGLAALRNALGWLFSRKAALFEFAARLVLRILAVILPFLLAGLVIAALLLGAFDINYYLTEKPPEFRIAAGLGAVLLAVMVAVLLRLLLSWAIALHLCLFEEFPPRAAFTESAARMAGRRMALGEEAVVWFALRAALAIATGALFAVVLRRAAVIFGPDLGGVLAAVAVVGLLWALADLCLAALSLGALAQILDRYHDPDPSRPDLAPAPLRLPLPAIGAATAALIALGIGISAFTLDTVQTEDTVAIIAHRGAAGTRPENTRASVLKAVEDGADWVEIDVQETADGVVVVMHDSDFMKLSGNPIKIWEATTDDLADIDIGSWFDPAYAEERVPTLAEVLELTRDRSKLLIELKYYGHDEALEARVAEIVEAAGMADQIATMSLKYPAVQKMKRLRPDWPAGVLAATSIGDLTGLEGDFIAINAGQATRALANAAGAAGKDLYVWTVNDPLQMSQMISLGVDGLITDVPDIAREVLEARAGMNTAERLLLAASFRLGVDLPYTEARDDSP